MSVDYLLSKENICNTSLSPLESQCQIQHYFLLIYEYDMTWKWRTLPNAGIYRARNDKKTLKVALDMNHLEALLRHN